MDVHPTSITGTETLPAAAPAEQRAPASAESIVTAAVPASDGSTAPALAGANVSGTEVPGTEVPGAGGPGAEVPATDAEPASPGFRERGRMRRRARFLRKARELAYRDLGGLVFEMHRLGRSEETPASDRSGGTPASGEHPRFGQRNDELVAAKLSVLGRMDEELRATEAALGAGQPVTVLREAGIAACPRCAAIHGSADRYCPACGLPMGRHADRPIAATPAGQPTVGQSAAAPPTLPAGVEPTPLHSPAAARVTPNAPASPPPATPAPSIPPPATRPAAATPAPPPARTAPPAAAPRVTEDDRPTEIIRPPGEHR